ncbi:hypothetical protein WA026_003998 [Henosepilachna vigintioctopunctata]|uniref:Uncharacterized protein n=1 Tax=Henosepilachna vigintioctopunctata TaxID=420089 RepID=A0AAW1UIC1_9CUCU
MELQIMFIKFQSKRTAYGLNINCKKNKIMIKMKHSPNNDNPSRKWRAWRDLACVLIYLDCSGDGSRDNCLEIRNQVQHRTTWKRVKACMCEPCTFTLAECDKVEAFEIWLYMRILKMLWRHKVRKKVVLQRAHKDRNKKIGVLRAYKEKY